LATFFIGSSFPHIAANELQPAGAFFAQHPEESQKRLGRPVLADPQEPLAPGVDLVDQRQVLVALLPLNFPFSTYFPLFSPVDQASLFRFLRGLTFPSGLGLRRYSPANSGEEPGLEGASKPDFEYILWYAQSHAHVFCFSISPEDLFDHLFHIDRRVGGAAATVRGGWHLDSCRDSG
jgi:hypothetical protein